MFITVSQKPTTDAYSEPDESSTDSCMLLVKGTHSVAEIVPRYHSKMEANPYFHISFLFRIWPSTLLILGPVSHLCLQVFCQNLLHMYDCLHKTYMHIHFHNPGLETLWQNKNKET